MKIYALGPMAETGLSQGFSVHEPDVYTVIQIHPEEMELSPSLKLKSVDPHAFSCPKGKKYALRQGS